MITTPRRIGTTVAAVLILPCIQIQFLVAASDGRDAYGRHLDGVDRKVVIQPNAPATGIESGTVVAYGQVLRPPYSLEFRGEKFFVNDVQVDPSLVAERQRARSKVKVDDEMRATARKTGKLNDEVRRLYAAGASKDQILGFLSQHDFVVKAEWEFKDSVTVTIKDKRGTFKTNFGLGDIKPGVTQRSTHEKPIDWTARAGKAKKNYLAMLEADLRNGRMVMFLSEGGVYKTAWNNDMAAKVREIMNDPALDGKAKAARLKRSVFPDSDIPARDVVANYKDEEWNRD